MSAQSSEPSPQDALRAEVIPDLRPFGAEPLLLARLDGRETRVSLVAVVAAAIAVVAVSYTAALTDSFYRGHNSPAVFKDIWHFITRTRYQVSSPIPYLRDYPSILLTVTITASVPLVYGLFRSLAVLHTELDESDCVRYDEDGRKALAAAVDVLNARLKRSGRYSAFVFGGMLVVVALLNLGLRGRLFPFAAPGDLYADWWARLTPFRVGGVVWVGLGAIGLYMVYVEAVVGVNYVRFLRDCRVQYQFRANPYNPDRFYGWSRLRKIVSNMEAGVICSAVTVVGMFFFLQPSIGGLLAAVALSAFMSVVLYVFIGAMTNLRRQVDADRKAQTAEVIRSMPKEALPVSPDAALSILAALARLEMLAKVPAMPIRKGVLLAGGVSLLGPLAAIMVQLLRYLLP